MKILGNTREGVNSLERLDFTERLYSMERLYSIYGLNSIERLVKTCTLSKDYIKSIIHGKTR